MIFLTGALAVPILGFTGTPTLVFLEVPDKLSKASTCDLHLRIPVAVVSVHGIPWNSPLSYIPGIYSGTGGIWDGCVQRMLGVHTTISWES